MSILSESDTRQKSRILDYGFDKSLTRDDGLALPPDMLHTFADGIGINATGSQEMGASLSLGYQYVTVEPTQDITTAISKVYERGGGIVRLRAVTYRPDKDIKIPSNVTLQGDGQSIIDFGGQAFSLKMDETDIVENSKVQDLTIQNSSTHGGVIDGASSCDFENVIFYNNGGDGLHGQSMERCIMTHCQFLNNTGDGLEFTATADRCKVVANDFSDNGGYGVNIVASSCDNNILSANSFADNFSGPILDAGVGTQVDISNIGLNFQELKNHWRAKNVSGGSLTQGQVVVYAMASGITVAPAENPTTDGWAGWQNTETTWATARGNNGNIHRDEDDGTSEAVAIRQGSTSGTWDLMRRAQFAYDLSSISAAFTVTAVTMEYYANSKTTTLGSQSLLLTSGGPASSSALASSDYEANVSNSTAYSSTVTLASITTGAYNTFTGNAAMIAAVQAALGGVFKHQMRFESERANSEPAFAGAGSLADMNWDFNNGSNPVKLTITYNSGDDNTGAEVTTTTTVGDDKVAGVVASSSIADEASGTVITEGKVTTLKVNGTTNISIGDYLGTYSVAGIAAKAAAGDMAFAIALEGYTADDSSGVIDALLVKPRKL